MGRLSGKVAIVTGASAGIGRATATLFAAEGARLVVGARRAEELETLVAAIRSTRNYGDSLLNSFRGCDAAKARDGIK